MCAKPGTNLLQAKFYISQYRIILYCNRIVIVS